MRVKGESHSLWGFSHINSMESQIFAKAITPEILSYLSYELQILCANYYNNVERLYVSEIFTPSKNPIAESARI